NEWNTKVMQKKDAKELLKKYNAGTCTEAEESLLEKWYLQLGDEELDLDGEELELLKESSWLQIIKFQRRSRFYFFKSHYIIAASLVFAVISLGVIFHFRESSNQQITVRKTTQPLENDVLP